ncbi:MAG: DUF3592 domain-containing protein [Thermoflexales bacterium]|nr:DUF3592 domain-containing protein [Thermoflexales bacterium]MCS7324386.1 DUF3592 domain-containing protein [Thermoflexales bacterium]MCX7940023.1 DUF3592 domain-containing protein [Thermoflexales bacterium]MDW8053289.1 DUF3592 domain-containing protein [Anaerolineae bacterium]MDW8291940.1 DUF3592 domain-containing protein [Anaerolineae bacterium]
MEARTLLPLAMVVTIAGILLLSFGSAVLLRAWTFYRRAQRTTAIVQRQGEQIVFRFRTHAGEEITLPAMLRTVQFAEGEEVSVLYAPDNPQDARLDRPFNWTVPTVAAALGLLIGLAGFVLVLLALGFIA